MVTGDEGPLVGVSWTGGQVGSQKKREWIGYDFWKGWAGLVLFCVHGLKRGAG